jgi:glycosyltransferase involved in cell wall biosynthesis
LASGVIRVLHIARYRSSSMERKLEVMATRPELALWLVRPAFWEDEYGKAVVNPVVSGCQVWQIPLMGKTNDPHRALYRTLTFGLPSIRPHIIHAEEEPDSLAALQIAMARRLFAPQAKLILHTWQNVNRPKRWYVRLVTHISLREADAILCANSEGVQVLREMGYSGPTAVIPPIGVDTRIFRPLERRPSQAFVVAYAGRFVPEKGLDTLMEAVARLGPGVELWLIGNGPYRPALEELSRKLRIEERVRWLEPVPPERMPELLAQVDVVVLPSRTTRVWKEQFGRILVEAMACKVPVVGSDSGAIPEVVGDAGLIFPEGDVATLAERLRQLKESPELHQEISEWGYQRATMQFSQNYVAWQTLSFYRMILEGNQ